MVYNLDYLKRSSCDADNESLRGGGLVLRNLNLTSASGAISSTLCRSLCRLLESRCTQPAASARPHCRRRENARTAASYLWLQIRFSGLVYRIDFKVARAIFTSSPRGEIASGKTTVRPSVQSAVRPSVQSAVRPALQQAVRLQVRKRRARHESKRKLGVRPGAVQFQLMLLRTAYLNAPRD